MWYFIFITFLVSVSFNNKTHFIAPKEGNSGKCQCLKPCKQQCNPRINRKEQLQILNC